MKLSFFTLIIICVVVSTPARAELRLAGVITDHAVLQRDVPIHLWGEASPAEKITITFHGQSIATTANQSGPVGGLAQTGAGRRSLHPHRPRQLRTHPF